MTNNSLEQRVERAILVYVAAQPEDRQALPAVQFINNRSDEIAKAVIASLTPPQEGPRCGDDGAGLCDACSLPAPELTQVPGCGGPLKSGVRPDVGEIERLRACISKALPASMSDWARNDTTDRVLAALFSSEGQQKGKPQT